MNLVALLAFFINKKNISESYEKLYDNKLDKLNEMNKVLGTIKLPKQA